jgi:hypothetical protein
VAVKVTTLSAQNVCLTTDLPGRIGSDAAYVFFERPLASDAAALNEITPVRLASQPLSALRDRPGRPLVHAGRDSA